MKTINNINRPDGKLLSEQATINLETAFDINKGRVNNILFGDNRELDETTLALARMFNRDEKMMELERNCRGRGGGLTMEGVLERFDFDRSFN